MCRPQPAMICLSITDSCSNPYLPLRLKVKTPILFQPYYEKNAVSEIVLKKKWKRGKMQITS